jgi:hypothetical protein
VPEVVPPEVPPVTAPVSRAPRPLPAAGLLLGAWEAASRFALARYRAALADGPRRNAGLLRTLLARHARTDYGRRHGLAAVARARDVEAAYRAAVPLNDYAALAANIQRIAAGEPDVLFPGRPPLFVSTSGTTGDPKLFPVTQAHQNQALRYVALLTPAARAAAVPGLGFRRRTSTLMVASRTGRATAGGIPVGNPSGAGIRRILRFAPPFWAYPPAVLLVEDYPSALYLHALFALRAPDLGCLEAIYCSHVVSWFGLIGARGAELVADLAAGTLSPDLRLSAAERALLAPSLVADPARARAVAAELARGLDGIGTRLWPGLRVVSSVTSGAFAASVPRLRALTGPGPAFYTTCFGATEGMVGINLDGAEPEHYALALGAAHFEFIPAGEVDAAVPRAVGPGEVEPGAEYEVVLTTRAGLYRYRLGDIVRITGRYGATPVFAFAHRRGNVVDLVGEKTTEQHLRRAMDALAGERPGRLGEYALAPDLDRLPYRYVVYAEWRGPATDPAPLAARLDALLGAANPAYVTLARQNGRLAPLELRLVAPGGFERLLAGERGRSGGLNVNQVKVPRLLRSPEQRALLEAAALPTV